MHRIKTRSAARGAGTAAVLAIVIALVSMASGCRSESAEQALRGDIASLQAAIEARDAGEMAKFLAEDFVGNDGLDRDGARRLAAVHFMRNASIGVTPGPLDVQMQGDHATVRTTVVLTGGSGGILPDAGRIRDVTASWRREDDDWLMTSLEWESR
ncbi:nuclear transport factor 2 family protein [Luteimonas soli]|uniref:Nuclear transport factor 2 family protein n=1 Tax=Luteimonas soli TaxID=1648966 RepID=A0ABV7XH57_9GAMM